MANAPITVLGAGSWGTALAILLARNHQLVRLWDHDPKQVSDLHHHRCNQRYLPHISFPNNLEVFADLSAALADTQDILIVVPSHAFREVLTRLKSIVKDKKIRIAWGTKGLDAQSGHLLHEVVKEFFGNISMAVISGPSFAKEVALGLPTAVTVAHNDAAFAKILNHALHNRTFRVYTTEDMIGVQVCGAVKNILAVAVGVSDGLSLGANARCALLTRGLTEMARLGITLGGEQETFMGLAGVGDLVLTATDDQSRNRRLGLAIGAGKSRDQAYQEIGAVIEGASNAKIIKELANKLKIDMPIVEQVYQILYHEVAPAKAVEILLSRDPKPEGL